MTRGRLKFERGGDFRPKMEIKLLDETDVTNLGISKLFLDSKKIQLFNKQPTNKSMVIFNSDKDVIVEYFSFFFFLPPQL